MNSDTTQQPEARVERRAGRLHSIQEVKDMAGRVVSHIETPLRVELMGEDVTQIVAGACVMAIPVALSEEVWTLGSELSNGRIMLIVLVTLLTLGFFVRSLFYPGKQLREYRAEFFKRVIIAYLVTFIVAMVLLILIDKGPLDDFLLAVKRAVIITFPASFSATMVDYIK